MTERDLHDQFSAWLHKQGIPYSHDRMDQKTSNTVGDPDFRCYRDGKVAMVEFKLPKKKTSPEQNARFDELAEAGCTVRVAYDVETAIRHIESELLGTLATETPVKQQPVKKPEPQFWVAHSSSLGAHVVCARNLDGHIGAVRIACATDIESMPRLPQGIA